MFLGCFGGLLGGSWGPFWCPWGVWGGSWERSGGVLEGLGGPWTPKVKKITFFDSILEVKIRPKIIKSCFQKRSGLRKGFCRCFWSICHEFVIVRGRPDMRSVCIFTSRNACRPFFTRLVTMGRFGRKMLHVWFQNG